MKKFKKSVLFLIVGIISILSINELFSQPEDPCDCPCEEILYDNVSDTYNKITIYEDPLTGCYWMYITLSPCGHRTIEALSFNFDDVEGDPCIDRTWTIKDSDNNTLWTGNPAEEDPQISYLIPPVRPCESQNYTYQFCPDFGPNGGYCIGGQYDITVSYILMLTEPVTPPCPPQNVRITFTQETNVIDNAIFDQNITLRLSYKSKDILIISEMDIDGQIIRPIDLKLYDVNGKEFNSSVTIVQNENKISINVNSLTSQPYFIEVLFSDGIWRKGRFIK